mmetsp:Transcript_119262/g.297511  ORF Transcript_119262/g.297511 Transcript_119262/m.297511 type:complete len:275 (+) Transcript_119262:667-1491(+)
MLHDFRNGSQSQLTKLPLGGFPPLHLCAARRGKLREANRRTTHGEAARHENLRQAYAHEPLRSKPKQVQVSDKKPKQDPIAEIHTTKQDAATSCTKNRGKTRQSTTRIIKLPIRGGLPMHLCAARHGTSCQAKRRTLHQSVPRHQKPWQRSAHAAKEQKDYKPKQAMAILCSQNPDENAKVHMRNKRVASWAKSRGKPRQSVASCNKCAAVRQQPPKLAKTPCPAGEPAECHLCGASCLENRRWSLLELLSWLDLPPNHGRTSVAGRRTGRRKQ